MPEDSQHHSPQIPLLKTTPPGKQLCRLVFKTGLVFFPCIAPVLAGFGVLQMLLRLPFPVGNEAWKHENGLDVQFFEDTKVGLDALCER
ncbi:hypothetical protein ARMSODRAFT_78398 [Armillaria solidipes]|uniref:Uncharacterized protein n=1 Tax=Armillaria solidipes TaxID=1076256 RepID=A0A2H3AJI5_9AGAR|nr:hypothetical protein ARMSODRAFT_78398 [Armillaria solidipes]